MGKKNHRPTICVDIDGVIASYGNHFTSEIGAPLPGAKEFLDKLHELDWKIIIFSCRPKWMIEDYMGDNSLYYDEINENKATKFKSSSPKPIADVYLDDRGLTFEGNYEDTLNKIMDFEPWWKGVLKEAALRNNKALINDIKKFLLDKYGFETWEEFVDKQKMGDCRDIVGKIHREFYPSVERKLGFFMRHVRHHWVEINGEIYEFSKGSLKALHDFERPYDVDCEDKSMYFSY